MSLEPGEERESTAVPVNGLAAARGRYGQVLVPGTKTWPGGPCQTPSTGRGSVSHVRHLVPDLALSDMPRAWHRTWLPGTLSWCIRAAAYPHGG